jgi:adenylate cyclase
MAVFSRPDGAVQAALEIQEKIGAFNRLQNIDPPLVIKIGVHHGPAIAINSNNQLDYFGRTVNIAARIQRESIGGDVVLTEDIVHQPAVQEVLQRLPASMSFKASLKGIEGSFLLYRLTVQAKEPQQCLPEMTV